MIFFFFLRGITNPFFGDFEDLFVKSILRYFNNFRVVSFVEMGRCARGMKRGIDETVSLDKIWGCFDKLKTTLARKIS